MFNIFQGDFDFISPSVMEILGYWPDEMSVAFYIDQIHPDVKPHFLQFEKCITEFFKALPFEKIAKYKVQYDFRIKTKGKGYVRLLHQVVQIDYDEDNFYRCLDLDTDITHIKSEGIPVFSLTGLDGEPSYYNIKDKITLTRSYDLFTIREREILKLIVEGKSCKIIAGELCVSLHTINAYRKNILLSLTICN